MFFHSANPGQAALGFCEVSINQWDEWNALQHPGRCLDSTDAQ